MLRWLTAATALMCCALPTAAGQGSLRNCSTAADCESFIGDEECTSERSLPLFSLSRVAVLPPMNLPAPRIPSSTPRSFSCSLTCSYLWHHLLHLPANSLLPWTYLRDGRARMLSPVLSHQAIPLIRS